MPSSKKINKKIIFFTNADWHFYNHLLPIALEAKDSGYNVAVLTHADNHKAKIEKRGIRFLPIKMSRAGMNPIMEIITLFRLFFILLKEKPDILHNFTLKPVLYGSIISIFLGIPKLVNTFLGMGYLFISNNLFIRFSKNIYCSLLYIVTIFKKAIFIVQNKDDKKLLEANKIQNVIAKCCVGIEIKKHPIMPEPKGKIVFALVARMLKDKGVLEFIEAASIIKDLNTEFWLVGMPDPQNNASIEESFLIKSHKEGSIKYLGYQQDIRAIWKRAHVAVLPSYREGLSRSLLEAGAYGRAIITTDAPGGRELVEDKEDGLLVPAKNSQRLEEAMRLLCEDRVLRKKLSQNMRKKIVENYDAYYIAKQIVDIYGK